METTSHRIQEHWPTAPNAGGLGRHPEFDEQSKAYRAVGAVVAENAPFKYRLWYRRDTMDQLLSSACTGMTAKGVSITSPNRSRLTVQQRREIDAYKIYHRAQELDPWPGGEPQYYGSSVLSAFKAAKEMGFLKEYRWCFGLDDVLRTLANFGPVGIGVNWYSSFDAPGKKGRLTISSDADVRGGHAVELLGVNPDAKTVRGINSWGTEWGDNGRFEFTFDTLDRLLHEDGEAVTAVIV